MVDSLADQDPATLTESLVFRTALERLKEVGWGIGSEGGKSYTGQERPACAAGAIAWAVTGNGSNMYAADRWNNTVDALLPFDEIRAEYKRGNYNLACVPFIRKWMEFTAPGSKLPYQFNDLEETTFEIIQEKFEALIAASDA